MTRSFPRSSAYPMISFEEAWAIASAHLSLLSPILAGLDESLGLVLAEDVVAEEDVPPFAAATMDGYAIKASDGQKPRRILAEQTAGQAPRIAVISGTCLRIMTGAPLPEGADAVIPVEQTKESGDFMYAQTTVRTGENVRPIGQDLRRGDIAVRQGTVIGPAEIGLLATLGKTRIRAYPRPRVAVIATGDELVEPDQPLSPGKIRDSNSYAIAAALRQVGAIPQRMRIAADNLPALEGQLLAALRDAEAIVTSGGVSMGTRDLLKPALSRLGTVHFGRVATKPGKPLTFATIEGKPVFALPGNPVSSLVGIEVFVRPALRKMAGHRKLWRPEVYTRLEHDIKHAPDRLEFQRAVLRKAHDTFWASTTGLQTSSRLRSLTGANALLCIPRGVGDLPAGHVVRAMRIDQPEVEECPWAL